MRSKAKEIVDIFNINELKDSASRIMHKKEMFVCWKAPQDSKGKVNVEHAARGNPRAVGGVSVNLGWFSVRTELLSLLKAL